MDVDVSTSVAGNKPQRIRRIQTVTLVLLFMAGWRVRIIRYRVWCFAFCIFSVLWFFTTSFRYFARPLWPTNSVRRRLNILVINAGINRNG